MQKRGCTVLLITHASERYHEEAMNLIAIGWDRQHEYSYFFM